MANKLNTLRDALDAAYPIPDTPHESVKQRARESRTAFIQGWQSCVASTALQAPVREAPGWQPIEAAPRYTDILVCGISGMAVASIGTHGAIEPSGVYATYDGCGGVAFEIGEITHYMPLPTAPVQEPKP